jgi:hypothetical protein
LDADTYSWDLDFVLDVINPWMSRNTNEDVWFLVEQYVFWCFFLKRISRSIEILNSS